MSSSITPSSSVDRPRVRIIEPSESTGTLVNIPTSRNPSETTVGNTSNSDSDLDSIWDADYEYLWEARRREEEEAVQELRQRISYMSVGFSVSPGQGLSRTTSKTGLRSALSSRAVSRAGSKANSRANSEADLGKEEQGESSLPPARTFWSALGSSRRRGREMMRLKRFHLIMIGLVAFDLMIVMVELILALLTASCPSEELYFFLEAAIASHEQLNGGHILHPSDFACTLAPSRGREGVENGIFSLNVGLLSVFTLEVFAAVYAFGPITYCTSWVSLLDGFVVIATLCCDIYFHVNHNPASKSPIALVILRLWKIFRAVHAIAHALELHYQEVVDTAMQGRDRLEWERISESIRLAYVRRALIKCSGDDVDPVLVEEEVKQEIIAIKERQAEENAATRRELEKTPLFIVRWRKRFLSHL